jgi:hypothetical protein
MKRDLSPIKGKQRRKKGHYEFEKDVSQCVVHVWLVFELFWATLDHKKCHFWLEKPHFLTIFDHKY